MPDIYLYTVPSDGTADVRLRDPTTLAGAGVTGTLAAVEGQDSALFAGVLEYSGALAAVEAQDAATFAGVLEYSGTLAATEAQDVAALDGTVAAPSVTGTLAAVEAQDSAVFAGNLASTALHGKPLRRRGKRVVFPDELEPLGLEVPDVPDVPLPSLETARTALAEAKAALETAAKAKLAKDRAETLAALTAKHNAALARYEAARERERAIIERLRDDDEFMLLAA